MSTDPALVDRYKKAAELAVAHAIKDGISDDLVLADIAQKAVDAQLELDMNHILDAVEQDTRDIDSALKAVAAEPESVTNTQLAAARATLQQAA